MVELSSNATILIYALAPVTIIHAEEHINAIRNYKNNNGNNKTTMTESSSIAGRYDWTIFNKYYTAEVGFKVADDVNLLGKGDEPAIIILASRDSIPSDLLKPILNQLSNRAPEFEIALLISYPLTSTSKASAIDEEAWEDLAMFNGFEWVDMISPSISETNKSEEEKIGFGEETGVGRVVDALQAYLWEGMVKAPKVISTKNAAPRKDETDEEDYSNLGAPPLPDPRPFLPTPLEFPDTFLPSIPRTSKTTSTGAFTTLSPMIKSTDSITFEDDFAPFVPVLSTTSFPSLPEASTSSLLNPLTSSSLISTSSPQLLPNLSNDELALAGLEDEDEGIEGGEGEDGDGAEDLENILEKLMEFKKEQAGLGLDERRARVEELMKGMNIGEW